MNANKMGGCGSVSFPFSSNPHPRDENDLKYLQIKEDLSSLMHCISSQAMGIETTIKGIKNFYPESSLKSQLDSLTNSHRLVSNTFQQLQDCMDEIKKNSLNHIGKLPSSPASPNVPTPPERRTVTPT